MEQPLLSIIIPTYGRSEYLKRAIDSGLLASLNGDVEIVVIPNGPNKSWKEVSSLYKDQNNVKFFPIDSANVCSARNHGLKKALGKYIRFLDDDDYLYPEGAQAQLEKIIMNNADVCSGRVEIRDNLNTFGLCTFPDELDFICASVQISGLRLPISNIYLRATIQHLWDEKYSRAEDYLFIIDLCMITEVQWVKVDSVIGCWFQHDTQRLSLDSKQWAETKIVETWTAERLFKLYKILKNQNRLSDMRDKYLSTQMWSFIGDNYYKDQSYCLKFISILNAENVGYFNCYGLRSRVANNLMIIYLAKKMPNFFFFLKKYYQKMNKNKSMVADTPNYVRLL